MSGTSSERPPSSHLVRAQTHCPGVIANASDNDWYIVTFVDGASCSGFDVALTSGGSPSTYAVFDVQTDLTTIVDQTTLSVSSSLYSGGSAIYIRVHASGDGPYGDYRLTLIHL
jgi:hypothetical protein